MSLFGIWLAGQAKTKCIKPETCFKSSQMSNTNCYILIESVYSSKRVNQLKSLPFILYWSNYEHLKFYLGQFQKHHDKVYFSTFCFLVCIKVLLCMFAKVHMWRSEKTLCVRLPFSDMVFCSSQKASWPVKFLCFSVSDSHLS